MNTEFISFSTPAGVITASARDGKVTEIRLGKTVSSGAVSSPCLKETKKQLLEYFEGKRKTFDLPLRFPDNAGNFRAKVWKEMSKIPYGKTMTYGKLAAKAGSPKAARAAGGACNKNHFLIVVPCHRVVGSDGSLTGFACGLNVKKLLLELENKHAG